MPRGQLAAALPLPQVQLRQVEILILEAAVDRQKPDRYGTEVVSAPAAPSGGTASVWAHDLVRRIQLAQIDALTVAGCRIRARLSDGSDCVLLGETAAEAHAWKRSVQEARGSSPRRAFLQAALGDALAARGKATAVEQTRWLCLAASWGETAEVGALLLMTYYLLLNTYY